MKISQYDHYRKTGVSWMPEIPIHWEVKALKFFSSLKARIGFHGLSSKDFIDEGAAYCITGTDFNKGYVDFKNCYQVSEDWYDLDKNIQVKNGDLLVTKDGTIGKVALVDGLDKKATLNSGVFLLRPSVHSRFVFWLLNSRVFGEQVDLISRGSTINHLYERDFNNFSFSIPGDKEQIIIATFLDHKTQQIDQLIAKKQTLIDKLNEQRIALITHAVTKGLNPDVEMKDSGVEWLGKVPKHWDVRRIKFALMLQRGHDLSADNREDGDVPVVSSAGISATHSTAIAKAPGIVTGRYGTIGKFVYVEEDYWPINTTLYSVDTYGNNVRFLWYMMHNFSEIFILNSKKSAVPGVDRNDIHPELTVIPPIEEQTQIVEYLDGKMAWIDRMLELNQQTIDKLKEYRTALITAAVTGKIDVRKWKEANHATP